jgi:hypothetical protein
MADLIINVDVVKLDNGEYQTISSYKIPTRGKVQFVNAAQGHGDLVITPKAPATALPFCKSDGTTGKTLQPVAYGAPRGAKICEDFEGGEFLYTARIGTTIPEDPIVIIEKKLNFVFDPGSFALGVGIAAVLTYAITKLWPNKPRPQQG